MAGDSPLTSGRPPGRKRQFPFGLVMLLFGFIGGFFTGIWAIKRAMTGPGWVQWVFQVKPTAPPAPVVVSQPAANPTPPAQANPTPPAQPVQPNPQPANPGTGTSSPANPNAVTGNTGTSTGAQSGSSETGNPNKGDGGNSSHTDEQGFVGKWEITDDLKQNGGSPSKVTSAYVFHPDGTGEFDTNGKKMYDLHWQTDPDYLNVTFDTDESDSAPKWTTKFRWSVDGSHTLLTLVPDSKDARAALYNITGPGVYHHKP